MSAIETIALSKLRISPHNVRKTRDKAAFDELKASLLSHGLLQSPLVTRADDGLYDVIAGARRVSALQALQKEGKLPKDHKARCQIADDRNAAELSLAENTVREAMHPADEFEAFAVLSVDNKPAAIAKRFGVTEKHVQQRLKLGKLAPEILKAYRDDKLNLECVMAFTLTDDHALQKTILNSEKGHASAHRIRHAITNDKPDTDSKAGRFVGIDAYRKAGGTITSDLFQKAQYFDDAELLLTLAQAKLDAAAAKLLKEGWAWAETAFEHDWGFVNKHSRIEATPIDAPRKLLDKQARVQAEWDAVDAKLDAAYDEQDEEAEELDAKRGELREVLDGIEKELESYVAFKPEEMKHAGVYVTVGGDGAVRTELGLVRKTEAKEIGGAADASASEEKEPAEKGLSQSLMTALKGYRLQVAQAAIAQNKTLAYDLFLFHIALDILQLHGPYDGPAVSFSRNHPFMNEEAHETASSKAIDAIEQALKTQWSERDDEQSQFAAFQKLTADEKSDILTYCVAVTLRPKLAPGEDDRLSAYDMTLAQSGVRVESHWRPTSDNYLSKITKGQLLELGSEIFSNAWADKRKNSKKGDLVKELDRAFADPSKFAGNKVTEQKLRTWLPEGMAFTLPEKKVMKKQKKAA